MHTTQCACSWRACTETPDPQWIATIGVTEESNRLWRCHVNLQYQINKIKQLTIVSIALSLSDPDADPPSLENVFGKRLWNPDACNLFILRSVPFTCLLRGWPPRDVPPRALQKNIAGSSATQLLSTPPNSLRWFLFIQSLRSWLDIHSLIVSTKISSLLKIVSLSGKRHNGRVCSSDTRV